MSDILVAYFSATGNTERAAKTLAEVTGAQLYQIEPAQPYTHADLNWTDRASRSSVECNDPSARPALAGEPAPVSECSKIVLCFPIWWHLAPPPVRTFLSSYDFSGKQIYLVATSGGSTLDRAVPNIQELAPGAEVIGGTMANWPHNSPSALEKWAKKVGLMS
ncbi:MAG: flavodoxin [Clostridia bacterium]|nr:flavodoxin [Clostridia bacterium]